MPLLDLEDSVLGAWRTNARVTAFLVESLPPALWAAAIPGERGRTIRSIAAHIHNARCSWTKTLGSEHGIAVPRRVDRRTVTPRQLGIALARSGRGIGAILSLGCRHGGRVPPSRGYTWRNLPLDVGHVLSYFVAHEAHHRAQIVLLARQLGGRLPAAVAGGLWQWRTRSREAGG